MEPIVYGLKTRYVDCVDWERVNFHSRNPWHELIAPHASPEFALLDSSKQIIYRWFGRTAEDDFTVILDPLCEGKD
jgi:hypothetical protein